ncbi:GAF domain-containing sensor histidine kinase [Desulfobacca acetoxidans]|uniref:histidine kinase n=1 Tax=Desulfobacca acetoxidans (strain ATCC 700848 / DSM 11109 / ASRB2) TaxID=880072 RepID=F2NJL0_DESAR|nr:ATP-binding protein [Desulfobacca acetoxidans]AEB09522.1 histidine kinase [Desulfobacca acetoxidans DSM 11109]HAY22441.1 sensor histidine kinase [Desulfobacterales bacterium]
MTHPADLEVIRQRILEKKNNYQEYNFGPLRDDAIKTFFDLAQEYETLENLFRVCVAVIKEFFDLDSRLFLTCSGVGCLEAVCDSLEGLRAYRTPAPEEIHLSNTAYAAGDSWVIPVRGNRLLVDRLPFFAKDQVIGMLEIFPAHALTDSDTFFFEKYANRLGYALHNKIITSQNIQHIRFINSLVGDIEHNVIVPNISLSLYLRHVKKKIQTLHNLVNTLSEDARSCPEFVAQVRALVLGIDSDCQIFDKQYHGVSLFLESLFRPSHFQRGHLVLRKRKCNVRSEIIQPQLELYLPKLQERHIEIDESLGGVPEEDFTLLVDKGLISQVYANLFSNAVKYSRPSPSGRKYLSFGRRLIPDFFGPGKDGVRFNVFTSGPRIPQEDIGRIFEEGYRGGNVEGEVGTGRGLYFVRNVVETHGGSVGCEYTGDGNDIYFVLPVFSDQDAGLGPLTAELSQS